MQQQNKAHLQTFAEIKPFYAPQIKRQDSIHNKSANKNQYESISH